MNSTKPIESDFLFESYEQTLSHEPKGFVEREREGSLIQSPTAWRHLKLARKIVAEVIDEKGAIASSKLIHLLERLREEAYSLGPGGEQEAWGMEHTLFCLDQLHHEPDWVHALKRIRKPEGDLGAERLIRRSLLLPEGALLSDRDARRAALSALLTPLRQNVGSCFATAPAILIQGMSPLQFLADIGQLFAVGALKRVVGGVEYSVPLSITPGLGSLLFPIEWGSLGPHPIKRLGHSPGLVAAFRAAGLLKEGQIDCIHVLQETISHSETPIYWLTADQLIREVLQKQIGVTPEQIERYQQEGSLLPIATPIMVTTSRDREGSVQLYLRAYQSATEAFVQQTEHPLLKAWEFTLASFAEVKADISRWNLYISLGFDPKEGDGVGSAIVRALDEKIARINDEIAAEQSRYDHTFAHVKSLEGRMRSSNTEQEIKWIQAEYRVGRGEMEKALSAIDTAHERGRRLSSALKVLIDYYLLQFPSYFQEVYDPQLREGGTGLYDDMPAGFRLLYKHGRTNPALWTLIDHPAAYLKALASFFTSTEVELSQRKEFQGIERELTDLVTKIMMSIREPNFLEASLRRLAISYREPLVDHPLDHLDQVKRKPWAYRSGGTMGTLVSAYFERTSPPKEEKRWIESEMELLVFYLDLLKERPHKEQQRWKRFPQGSGLLAYSPTHAFILKPGWEEFAAGWENSAYTYSWVRDYWVEPQRAFWELIWLQEPHQIYLMDLLCDRFPKGYRPMIRGALKSLLSARKRPAEFREEVLHALSYEKWLQPIHQHVADTLDQILYQSLPFRGHREIGDCLLQIFDGMEELDEPLKERCMVQFRQEKLAVGELISATQMQAIAQGIFIKALGKTRSPLFYTKNLVKAMRKGELRFPAPILFADPNWADQKFGFVVNPGTSALELWLFNALGTSGSPMSSWKSYLDGRDQREWGLYVDPADYLN